MEFRNLFYHFFILFNSLLGLTPPALFGGFISLLRTQIVLFLVAGFLTRSSFFGLAHRGLLWLWMG